jgi:AcrR family transcriptional regulator
MAYDRSMMAHSRISPARPADAERACAGLSDAGQEPRPLRADAARNRAAIVAAAREVFAQHGLEAPLEEIALRAGVGIATLYRRFPGREQLVAAALVDKVAEYAAAAADALEVTDPWAGFVGYVFRICELQAGDRGLSDLLSMTLAADEQIEQLRATANAQVIELVDRAKAAGKLRDDFVGEDLLLLLIASAAVVQVTRLDAPETWRRFVALALDGFRCQDGPGLPPPPVADQMHLAMQRLARERGCHGGHAPMTSL